MNKKQKIALWIGVALFAFMGLVPPWQEVARDGNVKLLNPMGYSLLFRPRYKLRPPYGIPEDWSPHEKVYALWIIEHADDYESAERLQKLFSAGVSPFTGLRDDEAEALYQMTYLRDESAGKRLTERRPIRVDLVTLLIQWSMVGALTGAATLTLRDAKKRDDRTRARNVDSGS